MVEKGNHVYRELLDKYSQEDIEELSERLYDSEGFDHKDLSTEQAMTLVAHSIDHREGELPSYKDIKLKDGDPVSGHRLRNERDWNFYVWSMGFEPRKVYRNNGDRDVAEALVRRSEHELGRAPHRKDVDLDTNLEQITKQAGIPYENVTIGEGAGKTVLDPEKESKFMDRIFKEDMYPNDLRSDGFTWREINAMIDEVADRDGIYGRWMAQDSL